MEKNNQLLLTDNLCEFTRKSVMVNYLRNKLNINTHFLSLPFKLGLKYFENYILETNHRICEIVKLKGFLKFDYSDLNYSN